MQTAFIFGSVSRGTEGHTSDLDVMVVGDVPYEEVIAALLPCQQELRREINPVVVGVNEFRRKKKEKDSLVSRVMCQPRILILGDMDDSDKS